MGKTLSTSAGAFAVAALLLHLSTNRGETVSAPPDTTKAVSAPAADPKTSPDAEGPWTASRSAAQANAFCGSSSGESSCAAPSIARSAQVQTCSLDSVCRGVLRRFLFPNESQIQFLIASVPDPQQTRLGLFTDSAINALQQAAFDADWELAAQWLPWRARPLASGSNSSASRAAAPSGRLLNDQPGLMVFRHSPVDNDLGKTFLFLFVVGETPTTGLNVEQFRAARGYMRALGEPPTVRFVGPTFSGSLLSLRELLRADQHASGHDSFTYHLSSGTATSDLLRSAFSSLPHVSVNGTSLSNGDQSRRFDDLLRDLNIRAEDAAILIEDESAYARDFSASAQSTNPKSLLLHYSRGISYLRNSYVETSATPTEKRAPLDVEFSLKDPDGFDDSLPIFSPEKTPVEQNAILNEITGQIRRKGIRLVEISATNVLDLLFLTKVLRTQCPDTRVLVTSPDLLFVKENQSTSLAGTLALSTYPLFYGAKDWLGEHPATHASANEEAIYHAAQLLLLSPEEQSTHTSGYAQTSAGRPASWLMVLDRDGFKPVRMIEGSLADPKWFSSVSLVRPPSFHLPRPPAAWTLLLAITILVAVLLCGLIFYLRLHPGVIYGDFFAPDIRSIADAHRLLSLTAALLIFTLCIFVFIYPLGSQALAPQYLVQTLSLSVPFCFALWLTFLSLRAPRNSGERLAAIVILYASFAAVMVAWVACCARSHDHAGFLFSYRCLEMQLGGSPSIPVLLLLGALLSFASAHLFRYYFAIVHRPRLFLASLDRFLGYDMRRYRHDLNRVLVAPMNLSGRRQVAGGITVATLLTLGTLTWRAHRKLASPEGTPYNLLILGLVLLVLFLIVLTVLQTTAAWSSLHQLLNRLSNFPLRSAFMVVDGSGKGGPIWAKRLEVQSLVAPTKADLTLRNLETLALQPGWTYPLEAAEIAAMRQRHSAQLAVLLNETPCSRLDRRLAFRRLRMEGAMACHMLCEHILIPEWKTRPLPIAGHVPQPPAPSASYSTAQSFVAVQLSAFIHYGVRQIQNLIVVTSIAFSLLVFALNLYFTQAPQALNRFLIGAFALIGYCFWRVLSQMERDPILSRLSGTKAGQLNRDFYWKLIGYAAVPFLSLLTSQFPSIRNFVSSWLEPSLEAIR